VDQAVPAGAIHAAPGGRPGAAGSAADPLPLDRALAEAPDGGTVVVHDGVYRVGDLKLRARVDLRAAPGADPVLAGSEVVSEWRRDGGRWVHDGWTHSFPHNKGPEYLEPDNQVAGLRDMVFVDGAPLRQVTSAGEVGPGTFFVDAGADRLHIGDDPAGRTVEAAAREYGMYIVRDGRGSTVRGLTFRHYADNGLGVGAANVTLEGNRFVHNAVTGALVNGIDGAADVVVRRNEFSHNGRKGLGAGSAHGLRVEGNVISDNNASGYRRAWDAAGVKLLHSDNVRVLDNCVTGNDGHAIWLDIAMRDAVVLRNHVQGNTNFGIFFEISSGALIADNLAVDNGIGLAVALSTDVRLINNTVVGGNTGILVKETERQPRPNPNEQRATFDTARITVRNNLLSGQRGTALTAQRENCRERSSMFAALDHNGYHRPDGQGRLVEYTPGTGGACSTEFRSLEDFRRATGYEQHGREIDASAALFRNPERGDYGLRSGTPAQGAGAALAPAEAEALGVAPGAPVDLGALHLTRPE
jgi:parallel beta-helix repeat protein